ncbi:MAG TPA: NAD-glutamate dehydrogenase [Solirubrobacteraceae bacterium]|nr:NAD-glutamate dehydrogenase [Solirubrobacteraceae bacterium]
MSLEAVENGVVEAVLAEVARRTGEELDPDRAAFVRQYYHWVPPQDLVGRSIEDLAGAVLHHWRTALNRQANQSLVSVFNPEAGRDGFSSPATIVEIVSDDMPFLVDSVIMELNRQGFSIALIIHPVIQIGGDGGDADSVIHAEVSRSSDPKRLARLETGLELVLEEVRAAVDDWTPMRRRALDLAAELAAAPAPGDRIAEAQDFLTWLSEDHFTFLGYQDYRLGDGVLDAVPGSGLGMLRGNTSPVPPTGEPRAGAEGGPGLLLLTRASARSRVHRAAHLDVVGVRRHGPDGRLVGEGRFFGLYTAETRRARPETIPLVREVVAEITEQAGFPPHSHDARALVDILESLPRELLLQCGVEQLFSMAMGIVGVGERQQVRLFVARQRLDRFVTCVLCLPRERFTTRNARRVSEVLSRAFGADEVDWDLQRSESVIVRLDFTLHCPDGVRDVDVAALETQIATLTEAWTDALAGALGAAHGERRGGVLFEEYAEAFGAAYRADFDAAMAVEDIEHIETVRRDGGSILHVLGAADNDDGNPVRCRLFHDAAVSLSDVVPTFEHLGVRVGDERFYEIHPAEGPALWIYDIGLSCDPAELERAGEEFAATFLAVWSGELEDDRLNALVLRAGLGGRQVTILRAILRYLRQATIPFSNAYMVATLVEHAPIAAQLVELFETRFDPDRHERDTETLGAALREAIDNVTSLDADRILSSFAAVIGAMLRTNYFRLPAPEYLAFKLDPARLDMLPLPRPAYEIFVCSPRVEGIHLRGGAVARGGLRWSDRREDFRTEVLGLMKAQMVKNALIVPVGSKGGFVLKLPPADPEALRQEAVSGYRTFLRGLLDLTDNYAGDEVVAPKRVVRYDGDDPYLVVAADKGTATFSDIANGVAAEYGFWLGDAFASGGSHGYDHKAMGITARGAWESAKRHFRSLGVDIAREEFTVVGIGDMSGDVFGNGMLRSMHIRLVAAFNHAHIFVDPDPDPEATYRERLRLFHLPRSSWDDYDRGCISAGGGIFSRQAKAIPISPEMAAALGIEAPRLSPNELISAILRAPVDLLYNGGVGTYVKASGERHPEVGDRANDAVRVDADALRCRVVVEGGNLGVTQRGRIEFALSGGPEGSGGAIYTDAVDNVAGVNCSDHEVNIKILLADVIASGELSPQERDPLLESMTDAVAEEVLHASYRQTQALAISQRESVDMLDVHARLMRWLEQHAGLNRGIEFLPTEAVITQRRGEGRGLVAPELCVLTAHTKIALYQDLLASDLPDDPYLLGDLERYFPAPLGTGSASADRAPSGTAGAERYTEQIRGHRLRRELIATNVANQLVERAGISFAFRLHEETGLGGAQLARAFAVAREVFGLRDFWDAVEDLDERVPAEVQIDMLIEARRLADRATRWLGRANARADIDVTATAEHYAAGVRELFSAIPEVLPEPDRELYEQRLAELLEADVVPELARRTAAMPALLNAFDIVEDAAACGQPRDFTTAVYFGIASALELEWLRDRILELPRDDRWQALARAGLRDDLHELHRDLTRGILAGCRGPVTVEGAHAAVTGWLEEHAGAVEHARAVLTDVRATGSFDTTTLPVIVRELARLVTAEPAPA